MKLGTIVETFTSKSGKTVTVRYPRRQDTRVMQQFINALIREDTFIERSGKLLSFREEQEFVDELLEDIRKNKKIYLGAWVGDTYAGSAEVRIGSLRHTHAGEVGISLAKEYRNEGIGKQLLQILIAEAKRKGLRLLTLNCFESNTTACALYTKLGFEKAGVIPGAIAYKGDYVGEAKFFLPLVDENR